MHSLMRENSDDDDHGDSMILIGMDLNENRYSICKGDWEASDLVHDTIRQEFGFECVDNMLSVKLYSQSTN